MDNLERSARKSSNFISKYSYDQLLKWGVSERWAEYVNALVLFLIASVAVYIVYFIVRKIFRLILGAFSKKGNRPFLAGLFRHRLAHFLALFAPVGLIKVAIPIVFEDFSSIRKFLDSALSIYVVFLLVWIILVILRVIAEGLKSNDKLGQRPIESYIQVVKIILYLFAGIVIFSRLTGKTPAAFFGILGAASAVLLLMFKDTIMGFVASIQVTTNDMVRIGDWIEMPNQNADGDVLDISLTTVKVQNWDKTITTIPTYMLIANPFINWRGMQEYGGRRIKRSIYIKQTSIQYVSKEKLSKFFKIEGIEQTLKERQKEIDEHNLQLNINKEIPLNGRNMTNAGIFRLYAQWYIKSHPGIHKDRPILVRQLAPSEKGLPFEIYAFANQTSMVDYEPIMADIFDHLLAAVPYFDLEIAENITGLDLQKSFSHPS